LPDFDEPEEVLTDSNLGPATTLEERYGKYGYFLPMPKQREKKPNIVDTRKLPVKESYGDAGIFALNSYRNQLLSEIHNLKLERKRRDAVKKNLQVIEKIWDSRWRDIFKADELISAGFSEEEVNRNMAKMKNDYEKSYGARQFIERSENGFMPDDVRNHRKKKTGEKERTSHFNDEVYEVEKISESLGQTFFKVKGINRPDTRNELLKI
jgi:hypothetical protein